MLLFVHARTLVILEMYYKRIMVCDSGRFLKFQGIMFLYSSSSSIQPKIARIRLLQWPLPLYHPLEYLMLILKPVTTSNDNLMPNPDASLRHVQLPETDIRHSGSLNLTALDSSFMVPLQCSLVVCRIM